MRPAQVRKEVKTVIDEKIVGVWTVLFGIGQHGFYTLVATAPGKKSLLFAFRPSRRDEAYGLFQDIEEAGLEEAERAKGGRRGSESLS